MIYLNSSKLEVSLKMRTALGYISLRFQWYDVICLVYNRASLLLRKIHDKVYLLELEIFTDYKIRLIKSVTFDPKSYIVLDILRHNIRNLYFLLFITDIFDIYFNNFIITACLFE